MRMAVVFGVRQHVEKLEEETDIDRNVGGGGGDVER